jgi:RHS repeat-associated protein
MINYCLKLSVTATPEYQYNLKDHLGNVRLTFTTKVDIDQNLATMEAANRNAEAGKFVRYDRVRIVNSQQIFDHTNDPNAGSSIRLSGNANEKTGLVKTLAVMPGDVVQMEVYAKYVDTNPTNVAQALKDLVTSISTAAAGYVTDGGSYLTNPSNPFPYTGWNGTSSSTGTGPKAYLNYIMFDKDFNPILPQVDPSQTFYVRVSAAAKEDGQTNLPNGKQHELLPATVTVKEAGYMYIYLSNEEASPVEVYFDDFKVTHTKSAVIQMDDYYPFGLTFNSYHRENAIENRYMFNSKELQSELSLGIYDYGNRMFMPEIGRWNRIDDFSDKYHPASPYNYALNNPLKYVDPTGDSVIRVNINDRSGYIHGSNTIYVDHTIYEDLITVLDAAVKTGTHVRINSSFRTNKKQKELSESKDAVTPAKPGNSPHNAGVGLDFNLYKDNDVSKGTISKNFTVTSDNPFIKAVKEIAGWRYGGDFSTPDRVHIDRRPGEDVFNTLRDANQAQMHGDEEVENLSKYVTRTENIAVGITKYQKWLNNPRDRGAAKQLLDEWRQAFSAIKGDVQQIKQQIKSLRGN